MANTVRPTTVQIKPTKDSSGIEAAINQEIEQILAHARQGTLQGPATGAEQIALAIFRYRRPVKGIQAWLNRFLGPLPKDAKIINPTKERLSEVGSYRLFGFITSILAILTIFGLATAFPFLAVSPLSLASDGIEHFAGAGFMGTTLTILAMIYMFRFAFKFFTFGSMPREGGALNRFAMAEEQWFRMGSETWTKRQRIQSCVVFGLVHIQNVFYPITSLIVVGLLGGVFMTVYLRVYRKTNDYTKATLASTKLHAAHNYFSLAYLAIALVWWGASALIG